VIERLQEGIRKAEFDGVSRITQAFRDRYYDIVKRTLVEQRQIIPCMAGVASAQIAPNGDVWTCCIRAESVGNLRDHNYDFKSVWTTIKANELRRSIKAGECHCPLANASYTNMLCHMPTLVSVAADVGKGAVSTALSARNGQARSHSLPVFNDRDKLTPYDTKSSGSRSLPVFNNSGKPSPYNTKSSRTRLLPMLKTDDMTYRPADDRPYKEDTI
jgi:hypothetical protein